MNGAPVVIEFTAPDELRQLTDDALTELAGKRFAERLWDRDATLWKDAPEHVRIIENALGWLSVPSDLRAEVEALAGFVDEVRAEGFAHVVLLGMGGSSLAPEVLHDVFGAAEGYLDLRVLDSTDPEAVLSIQDELELEETLFIVASKSGGTTETASFHAYFLRQLAQGCGDHAGHHFVAITDEGTSLQKEAVDQGFQAVFVNPSDIGGRYSALSFFGMVPAALMGIDVARLLDDALSVAAASGPDVEAAASPALQLGAIMGGLARAGRDKLTILAPRSLSPFGGWVEQLIAESTGKEGKGILPVDLEAIGAPGEYGDDRLFVYLKLENDDDPHAPGSSGAVASNTGSAHETSPQGDLDAAIAALVAAGQPVVTITLPDCWALGGQFLLWEIATAAAGALLDIDPFDQPNVQESKDNTRRRLDVYTESGGLPAPDYSDAGNGIPPAVAVSAGAEEVQAALECVLCSVRPHDYVCLQAYVAPSAVVWTELDALRRAARGKLGVATTAGYGPRFLHSTGQYHKGGPDSGVYVQLISRDLRDARIPGQLYPFSVLKRAQADGDLESLRSRGRRVLRIELGDDPAAGLATVVRAMQEAVTRVG
jgi:glucose-6-phosphate isomerase